MPWVHCTMPSWVVVGAKLQGLVHLETNPVSWPQMCKPPPLQHSLSLGCGQSSIPEQSQTLEKNYRINMNKPVIYLSYVATSTQMSCRIAQTAPVWPIDGRVPFLVPNFDTCPVVFRGPTLLDGQSGTGNRYAEICLQNLKINRFLCLANLKTEAVSRWSTWISETVDESSPYPAGHMKP